MAEPLPDASPDPSAAFAVPPAGGWTVDDLDAWPETLIRHELTDGALTVSPSPGNLHQIIVLAFCAGLMEQAPEDMIVTQGVEIRFARKTTRIPDVLVVRTDEPRRHWFAPAEVLLAVEIESPGSHVDDRLVKPALYAQYGVPYYWRVETDPLRVVVHRLADRDVYTRDEPVTHLRLDEPFPVDLALAERLPTWAR